MRNNNAKEGLTSTGRKAGIDWEALANDPIIAMVRYQNNPELIPVRTPTPPPKPRAPKMPLPRKPKVDRRAIIQPPNPQPREAPKRQNRTPPSVMRG